MHADGSKAAGFIERRTNRRADDNGFVRAPALTRPDHALCGERTSRKTVQEVEHNMNRFYHAFLSAEVERQILREEQRVQHEKTIHPTETASRGRAYGQIFRGTNGKGPEPSQVMKVEQ
jgi:hypothetical protein